MAGAPPTSQPPDWQQFTLDLSCPRCGYNLRMLTGSRCPECGLDFDWAEVIAAADDRRACPLFEYQWRKRPIRSFLHTVWLTMRPKRLWSQTSLAVEPRVGPLFALLAAVLVMYVTVLVASQNLHNAYSMLMYYSRLNRPFRWSPLFIIDPAIGHAMEAGFLLVSIATVWMYIQVFRQSIARCRVRQDHFLRILILSFLPMMAIKAIVAILTQWLPEVLPWSVRGPVSQVVQVLFDAAALLFMMVSLKAGLTDYLKLDRGGWVAVAAMTLTLLTWVTLVVVHTVIVDRWNTPLTLWVEQTWPGVARLGWLLGF